jgi:isopentenyl phosphate kinase
MPDVNNILLLAQTVAKLRENGAKDLVIVHGAGSFGHALVLKYKINDGVKTPAQKLASAQTHSACASLSSIVTNALLAAGVSAISIPPAAIIKSENKRISEFNDAVVFAYLQEGFVPVLYGDMVPDSELGFSVCSGDQIVSYLGKKADRLVFATNVDGVMADGKLVEKITAKNFPDIQKHLASSSSPDVTGGMAGKVKEIMSVKKPSFIVNASYPDRIVAIFGNKKTKCTEISQ